MAIVYFMSGVLVTIYAIIGFVIWRYATWRASGPRGIILNPSDDYRNPFVCFGIIVWLLFWPIFSLISCFRDRNWDFREIFTGSEE